MTPEAKLLRLAKYLGLKAEYLTEDPNFAYTEGHIRYLGKKGTPEPVSNLAHDLAHWLVASPERRLVDDFGLGDGPDSMEITSSLLSEDETYDEEVLASALGVAIEIHVGHDPGYTMDAHNWENESLLLAKYRELAQRGLIKATKMRPQSVQDYKFTKPKKAKKA